MALSFSLAKQELNRWVFHEYGLDIIKWEGI